MRYVHYALLGLVWKMNFLLFCCYFITICKCRFLLNTFDGVWYFSVVVFYSGFTSATQLQACQMIREK